MEEYLPLDPTGQVADVGVGSYAGFFYLKKSLSPIRYAAYNFV